MRWDGDTRGHGIGDAAAFADGAAELLEAMRTADWVRQRRDDGALTFEVVTGLLDDSRFAPHGHGVRLHVAVP